MVTVFLAANILKRNQLAVKNDYDTQEEIKDGKVKCPKVVV